MVLPSSLSRRGVLALLAAGAATRRANALPPPDLARAVHEVVDRGNDWRRAHGRPPLARHAALGSAALEFATFMARSARYGHRADGRTPEQRAESHGYAWCFIAENIAVLHRPAGFATSELARRLVQGWIGSPGHRRNLLDAEAVETGVAIARARGEERYYAVQLFGRRRRAGRCDAPPARRT